MNVCMQVPPFFRPITPGLSAEEARAETLARIGEQLADLDAGYVDQLVVDYQKASEALAAAGVFYAATCLGRINNEPSAGTLIIGLQPLSYADSDAAAVGIHEIMLGKRGRRALVSTRDLPCGKAVIVIDQSPSLRIPAELTVHGEDIPIDVAQLQAFIPVSQQAVPGAQEMLVLTFSTPSTDHWAEYSEVVVDALRSLRFTPDEESAQQPTSPTEPVRV
ncbi:hypothetical protein [Streptomyces sp. NPDC093591]|uniref:hypothetical protein n=1 Tax=Streptomyces sp. NPDC093591 TaxID=3366044 RepID=UPI0038044343